MTRHIWIAVFFMVSCNKIINTPSIDNPNGIDVSTVVNNATIEELTNLATGTLSAMRTGYNTNPGNGTSSYESYCKVAGTLGREVYVINESETRWVNELAGQNGVLDPGAFYNGYYFSFSNARQTAALLQYAALHTAAIDDQQRNGVLGFTNTIMAFEMLHILNMQGKNGIRLQLDDYLHPGPFVSYDEGLTGLHAMLDSASVQLQRAGNSFFFPFPSGFAGFDTPSGFLRFNRAIAARIDIYQQHWQTALDDLGLSFFNIDGDLSQGPAFAWGLIPDMLNPLYQKPGNTVSVVANNSFAAEAEYGDARLAKILKRTSALNLAGISGAYDVNLYPTNLTQVSVIRNEELVLIYAEAKMQLGALNEAVKALNTVRTKSGKLPAYTGEMTRDALIGELLRQRRYSLFYEGHRWIDMRRYHLLGSLPIDQPGQTIFDAMPRPLAEVNWGK